MSSSASADVDLLIFELDDIALLLRTHRLEYVAEQVEAAKQALESRLGDPPLLDFDSADGNSANDAVVY